MKRPFLLVGLVHAILFILCHQEYIDGDSYWLVSALVTWLCLLWAIHSVSTRFVVMVLFSMILLVSSILIVALVTNWLVIYHFVAVVMAILWILAEIWSILTTLLQTQRALIKSITNTLDSPSPAHLTYSGSFQARMGLHILSGTLLLIWLTTLLFLHQQPVSSPFAPLPTANVLMSICLTICAVSRRVGTGLILPTFFTLWVGLWTTFLTTQPATWLPLPALGMTCATLWDEFHGLSERLCGHLSVRETGRRRRNSEDEEAQTALVHAIDLESGDYIVPLTQRTRATVHLPLLLISFNAFLTLLISGEATTHDAKRLMAVLYVLCIWIVLAYYLQQKWKFQHRYREWFKHYYYGDAAEVGS